MPRVKKVVTDVPVVLEVGEFDKDSEVLKEPESTTKEDQPSNQIVTLVINSSNLTTVVSEVFFLGQLGGKLTPGFLPRLKAPPYIVKVDVSPESAIKYASTEGRNEYDEGVKYNHAVIITPDPLRFIEAVLEVGLKGGIITPKKVVQSGLTLIVPALINGEFASNPVVSVLPSK
jgi:hypothetical protein